jgi:hypothetical protein
MRLIQIRMLVIDVFANESIPVQMIEIYYFCIFPLLAISADSVDIDKINFACFWTPSSLTLFGNSLGDFLFVK